MILMIQIILRIRTNKKVSTVDLMALVDDTEDYIKSNYYDGQPINPMLSGPAALLGAVSHSVIRGQIII